MKAKRRFSFFYRNGLSIVFLLLMFMSLTGQMYTGWQEHNDFLRAYHVPAQPLQRYLLSGHFLQSTFENWESEFLQMALFVLLTIFLRQQGSSESKKLEAGKRHADEYRAKAGSPWAVRKGGVALAVYKHSLSISLFILFVISFAAHWYGSWLDFNEKQYLEGRPVENAWRYLAKSKFWFESFQNWESEFIAVISIVVLSIFLRQKGSPESKPVDAANSATGSE